MTTIHKSAIFTVIAVNMHVEGFMDVKKIGQMVRFHRKMAGISQIELAELGGVGKTVVFDIEKGKLSVRFDTLLSVLNVLNIHIDFQGPLMTLFQEKLNEAS